MEKISSDELRNIHALSKSAISSNKYLVYFNDLVHVGEDFN